MRRQRALATAAGVIALVATVGSLYLSLGLGLTPCRFCWYQRVLMYPLVLVFATEAYRGISLPTITVPMATLGFGIASYHVYVQHTASVCGAGVAPCSTIYLRAFGAFTIPMLSGMAFGVVLFTLLGRSVGADGSGS